MSSNKHAYKAGLFVLAGLVAIVAGTLVTTSRALFQTTVPIKSYFTRAVTGVARGTPVRYLGVTIGKVTDVGFPTGRFVYDDGAANAGEFNRNVIVSMDIFVPEGQMTDEVRREFAFGRNHGLCARGDGWPDRPAVHRAPARTRPVAALDAARRHDEGRRRRHRQHCQQVR